MRHEDRPGTVLAAVQAASFPVYGLNGYPLDLFVTGFGVGISHLGNFMSVSLLFTSPRYANPHDFRFSPKSENFRITSVDATTERLEKEHMVFHLEEPSEYFNSETGLFYQHHFSEEEQKLAGDPFLWEGTLSLANTAFSGKILSWRPPLQVSVFLLKSEETILIGNAYGPSEKELVQLLEGLQVMNHQHDLLKQYQNDLENLNQ